MLLLLLEEKWQSTRKTNWGILLSRQEGQRLQSAPRKAFYQYLFRSLTPGLAFKFQALSPALGCHTAHMALDSCEIPPAGPSKRSRSRTRCLQQLQVSRERSHCWYPRLLKCFQSLSCARRHGIYSEPVFSFLLKLTRNPPMSLARVNKLNKLTILFTFSETGSFCSCFNLFSLITQNKQSALWWGMDTSLLEMFACNLLYFTALCSSIPECQMPDESMA